MLCSYSFSDMSYPRHSLMMTTKEEPVQKGATTPSVTISLILLTILGVSHTATRTACSDALTYPVQSFTLQHPHRAMRKLLFLSLLSLTSLCSYAQSSTVEQADTLTTATPVEMWEYKTIYAHNTHPNAKQGEVEFKSHKDAETLNKYGREGWELVSVTPVIAESMGNNRTYTQLLVYTFKRRLQAKR